MMSENNFDRGEVWLIADATWSPLIDSLIPWKRVFLYDKGKSMWINDIVICSGCLVISWSFKEYILQLFCVLFSLVWFVSWKLIALFEFHFGVGILDFSMILSQNFKTCLLIIFHVNKVRNDDWRCLRLLNRPKRLLIKSSIFRWSYWIFSKGLIHDFESKIWKLSFWLFFV